MADLSVVMDKLQGFETAEDLADFFRGYGIKAQPRNARMCAISQFVVEETGLEGIVTNTECVTHYMEDDGNEDYDYEYQAIYSSPHTQAMEEFVKNYDRGYYPDLVTPGCEVSDYTTEDYGCQCSVCQK